jgi:hypothetical protein
MKRLLDLDPLTGASTWFYGNNDGTFKISNQQSDDSVSTILESNKRLASMEQISKKGIKKGYWHYATIPPILVAKWTAEIGSDILDTKNQKELFKRLNNPDYQYLKTTHGRHSVKNS